MYQKKKTKLYISEIMDDPAITYPAYYLLSPSMADNEMLHGALTSVHMLDFSYYETPKSFDDIFKMFDSGTFPLYKEKYIVGYFGQKMMYLERNGWHRMPATRDVFNLEHWLVC